MTAKAQNETACVLPYQSIRNLTSPTEKNNGVQTWFANLGARDILGIPTTDNLRSYIAEHSERKRNGVHEAIAHTIEELPDRFINRNSGITITCTECDVDDNGKVARLKNASIINGAQTQGELKRYFEAQENGDAADFLVRAEIIMEPNHDQIVEIAIARNTATAVKSVSQAGARGYLTDLKGSVEAALPGETIRLSETEQIGLDTQSVLQWTRLLMPARMLGDRAPAPNFAYKQGGKCLSDFCEWAQERKSSDAAETKYQFTVQVAPVAIKTYRRFECHEGWNGHRLHEKGKRSDKPEGGRPVRRDADGRVSWVAPGILFPVMFALSAFVKEARGGWTLDLPKLFKEEELIRRAVQQFRAMERQVAYMGRSEAAYDALSIYTETIASVLAEAK
jgi:hypothetical protein